MTAEQVRLAVVGCGYWGKNLVRNFAALGALVGLSDSDPATAARLAREHGVPALTFEQILDEPQIDAVAIATPAVQHAAMAQRALAGGKHVFVEKPLALAVADAEALSVLAEDQQRILMVGHLLRYHPAFLRLQDLVDGGDLGELQYLYSNRLNLGKVRREENILWSFAPHDISMILSLVGDEPVTVSATGSTHLNAGVADVTTTHLAFANGQRAHVFVSWLHPFKEQKLVVVGSHAMAVLDDGQPWATKLLLYRHRIEWDSGGPQTVRATAEPVPLTEAEPLHEECAHFLHCVSTSARPRTDGREGVRVLRVLAAAQQSMQAGGSS